MTTLETNKLLAEKAGIKVWEPRNSMSLKMPCPQAEEYNSMSHGEFCKHDTDEQIRMYAVIGSAPVFDPKRNPAQLFMVIERLKMSVDIHPPVNHKTWWAVITPPRSRELLGEGEGDSLHEALYQAVVNYCQTLEK